MGNFYIYQLGLLCTRVLPLKAVYKLAVFLSDIHYRRSHEDRRAVESNLKAILKTDQVEAHVVREVFRNFGRYMVEFFLMPRMAKDDYIRRNVRLKNQKYLNQVLQNGRGGILLTGHMGSWELGGGVLANLGFPVSLIALPHKDPRVNNFFNRQREACGEEVIATTVALRKTLKNLRANGFVAIAADRDFSGHGIEMDFMGCKVSMPKGAAVIALKTGAPLIPIFFFRNTDGHFDFIIEEPIDPGAPNEGDISDAKVVALMRRYIPLLEEKIRAYPDQWLLFREFWAKGLL